VNAALDIINDVRTEFEVLIFNRQTLNVTGVEGIDEPFELTLHGSLTHGQIPFELMQAARGVEISVIVQDIEAVGYEWFCNSADAEGFTVYAESVLNDMLTANDDISFYVVNIEEMYNAVRGVRNLILTFIYGFVGMLILVGLTNVISTISTNIRSRSREFAVLRSAGMTYSGLKKMLNLESILSSARSLLFGLPIGCGLSYLMYQSTIRTADFSYKFPWFAVLQCVLGVFAVTWVTMRYSASRLRGKNIVETIRAESGR
jgi:putative ABC transport system permease protein